MIGWEVKALGEVCTIKPPKTEVRGRLLGDDEVSFAPMEDLGIGEKYLQPRRTRRFGEVSGSYTYFANGDVLMAKITPCFENGKLGVARGLTNGVGFGSSEYFVFRPTPAIDSEFLYYYLARPTFLEEGARTMTGAVGHKRVTKEFIESYSIPLPPPTEQRRIVAILDGAFEGIATAKANAAKNLQNARRLFESWREAALTTDGGDWAEAPLSDLCDIKHGYAFEGEFFTPEGDYVLLTPGNYFESGGYRDRGEKQKYFVGPIPHGYILPEGSLLVAMTEQAAGLLGSPLIVPESDRFLHNQRLGLVVGKPDVPWVNTFFFHVFNLARVRAEIHATASGAKVRHTSPGKIGAVRVHFPRSTAEQRRVASELFEVAAECDKLVSIFEDKIAALHDLRNSLLHQAFSGAL